MDKLLTVVIAAYNMEELLPRCLDSLNISPELQKKVQVLVVNDGSKDRTLEIAKEYELKFPGYIYAIDQTNGNYGKVMNHGLSLAKGKYFRTLDADDWYDTSSFSTFIQLLESTDADMIINEKMIFNVKDNLYIHVEFGKVSEGEELPASNLFNNISEFESCLNVQHLTFKTSILKQSNLKWLEGICYTDTMFDIWPLPYVKTVLFIKLPVYIYREGANDQSMSPKNVRKNFHHFEKVANAVLPYVLGVHGNDKGLDNILEHYLFQLLDFIFHDIIIDNKNIESISNYYSMFNNYPELQVKLKNRNVFYGCHYLENIESKKFSLKFIVLRKLKKIKKKIRYNDL